MVEPAVSAREAEVLAAVGEHLTNAEVAARLFISIRTVESHVSSLLRKLGASDRRALVSVAAEQRLPATPSGPVVRRPVTPSALTSFVGRAAERAALADALTGQRLVSAVGSGGVGKTRLVQAVAADVVDRFADGVWYVDLVPVTDAEMVAAAVAAALGLGEQQGRTAEDTLLGWAADRQALLVLDNCEHLLDGVALLVERLLAGSPELVVLATTRARLVLPFERVFPVAGMSVAEHDGTGHDGTGHDGTGHGGTGRGGTGHGDAIALFEERAASAGSVLSEADRSRVARICRSLDGVPLAIELAAARLPSIGLDGLEAGLADRLQMLTGGRRVDGRHSSLRSMLDWSCALLDAPAQAVLRRVSAFAGPFRADGAAVVAGWDPVSRREVGAHLATLADQSLLVLTTTPDGTRYRALETVRQYGAELLDDAGELVETHAGHLKWAQEQGEALLAAGDIEGAEWRARFDQLADELRAAVRRADRPGHRATAHDVATVLAALCYRRGMPRESQLRHEQAAEFAPDQHLAAAALHRAAGAAETQLAGDEALRLHRAAADAALRAGEPGLAARDIAQMAELMNRASGVVSPPPDPAVVRALIDEAGKHAHGDDVAHARIAIAEAFAVADTDPQVADLTDRALELARRAGNPMAESAALDRLTTVQLSRGEERGALASAMRRTQLLAPVTVDADLGFELSDAHVMAAESAIAAGDLAEARRLAERIRDLPLHREVGHVAVARLLVVMFLEGDWDGALAAGARFREGWERAGRPRVSTLRRCAHAMATAHGLRGEDPERETWLEIFIALVPLGRRHHDQHPTAFFDALLQLHRDRPDQALESLAAPPHELRAWYQALWRPWYAALWAEAAVLAGTPDAAERVEAVRSLTADNPVASALNDRAAALLVRDTEGVLAAAAALDAAGCRYQWARSLVLAGGADGARGRSALIAAGVTVG
jgi:predicted ATPase/DNA-binding CsgD family transcriptional regulator